MSSVAMKWVCLSELFARGDEMAYFPEGMQLDRFFAESPAPATAQAKDLNGIFIQNIEICEREYLASKTVDSIINYSACLQRAETAFEELKILGSQMEPQHVSSQIRRVQKQLEKMRKHHPDGPSCFLPSDAHKLLSLVQPEQQSTTEVSGQFFNTPSISKEKLLSWFTGFLEREAYRSVSIPDFRSELLWNQKIPLSTIIALRKDETHKKFLRKLYQSSHEKNNEKGSYFNWGSLWNVSSLDPLSLEQRTLEKICNSLKPQEWGYSNFQVYKTSSLLAWKIPLEDAIDADIIVLNYKPIACAEEC